MEQRVYKKISDLENESDWLFLSWVADASASISTIWTSPRPDFINRLAREYRVLKDGLKKAEMEGRKVAMEFSNEELQEIAGCPMDYHDTTRNLAKALLSERAEREKNPGVWDGAPDDCDTVTVTFYRKGKPVGGPAYIRTLPKTKAREIAERVVGDKDGWRSKVNGVYAVDMVEAAINEALGGEK